MFNKNPLRTVLCRLVLGIPTVLATWTNAARADVFTQVPEAAGYQLLYTLHVPNKANYGTAAPAYSVDNSASLTGSISRVAYYMELQTSTGQLQYAYASMDAFTQNVKLLGLPTAASGAYFNQSVYNLNVYSNVAGVTVGTGQTGNLEFFHSNYSSYSATNAPNASGSINDWGDNPLGPHGGGTYGSFQIANPLKSQEIICYNDWGGTNDSNGDIGLGNSTGNDPDWSFAKNAATYTVKNIQVLVKLGALPARTQIMPLGDSITDGYQSVQGGGYRTPLYSLLAGTGRTYDFAGSSGDNKSTVLDAASEQQHEGHSGYRIDQLDANLAGDNSMNGNDSGYWLADNPGIQPKYILVHAGTNDINGSYDPTTTNPSDSQLVLDTIGRLETFLNDIIAQRPTTHILLAGIIPINAGAEYLANTALYNQEIQSMIISNPQYAGKLTYVDQHSPFLNADGTVNTSLYADNLHPNDTGYQVMANTWFNAINALDTAPPLISGLSPNSTGSSSTVISANVNPSGQAATCYVRYGATVAYGNLTPNQPIAAGMFTDVAFQATLTGLTPGANYHYEVIATTSAGTTTSPDATFTAGTNAPVITSAPSATAGAGQSFSYQITATNNASTYAASDLPGGLSVNASTGVISGTPTSAGTSSVAITASNSYGAGGTTLTLTVDSTYSAWKTAHFTAADLQDPTISGDTATPAGDGIPNLLKYALNLSPKVEGIAGLPTASVVTVAANRYLALTYTQLRYVTDISDLAQTSGDLQTWNSGSSYTAPVSVTNNPDGLTQTVMVRDVVPFGSGGSQFMRLEVTKP